MKSVMLAVSFVTTHAELVLTGILAIMGAFGVIVETVSRFLPTKNGRPALAVASEWIGKASSMIQKVYDLLKFPNKKS